MTSSAIPAYLSPDWRYAGDDWSGANALIYTVYSQDPEYAADGVTVIAAGVPMNLTGFTVQGSITLRPRPVIMDGQDQQVSQGTPISSVTGAIVDPLNGVISLSVPSVVTGIIARQALECWNNPSQSRLLVRPQIVDPSGNVITQGIQPLFVF